MCFSLEWLRGILIWLVVIGAAFAILKILLPLVLGPLGAAGATVIAILNIAVWAFVVIAIIIFAFDLISCFGRPALAAHGRINEHCAETARQAAQRPFLASTLRDERR